jgi:hypothetical protein
MRYGIVKESSKAFAKGFLMDMALYALVFVSVFGTLWMLT